MYVYPSSISACIVVVLANFSRDELLKRANLELSREAMAMTVGTVRIVMQGSVTLPAHVMLRTMAGRAERASYMCKLWRVFSHVIIACSPL